ncbi:MAG: hypothetical protein DWQ02_28835 [Bacteroidetes bacterium]|nr:MAG: hypothetical protein DWQ02_28835 [Bacteroidota bacterium]
MAQVTIETNIPLEKLIASPNLGLTLENYSEAFARGQIIGRLNDVFDYVEPPFDHTNVFVSPNKFNDLIISITVEIHEDYTQINGGALKSALVE